MNVKVKSTVKHNGVRYQAGQTIENIDEAAGQTLIDLGVAEAVNVEAKAEEPKAETKEKPKAETKEKSKGVEKGKGK